MPPGMARRYQAPTKVGSYQKRVPS